MWVGHFGRKKLAFVGTIPGRGWGGGERRKRGTGIDWRPNL